MPTQYPAEDIREAEAQAQQTFPDEYDAYVIEKVSTHLYKSNQTPKNVATAFLLETKTIQIEEQKILLGHVLILLHAPGERLFPYEALRSGIPLKEATCRPPTIAVFPHTDCWVPITVHECAKIFTKLVQWDRKEISTFKTELAFFRYLFAHAHPFLRGSAAVGEWIEMALCALHQLTYTHGDIGTVDLEALTAPSYSAYEERYNQLITIQELT